ncbi:MAG: flagellar basal body P-ring formation chaperone FlgA [Candidatus Melainabacteria bacterium]
MKKSLHNLSALLVALALMAGFAAQAQPLTPAGVEQAVRDHVEKSLAGYLDLNNPANHVTLTLGNIPGLVSALKQFEDTPEKTELKLELSSSLSEFYSDRTLVRIRVIGETGTERMMGVPVRIQVEKPVWVAKINVDAKAPLRTQHFALKTMDVSQDLPHTAGREFPLNQYTARVNLRAGEPLDIRKVNVPPAVTRNSTVHIILISDGMNISVMGTAMADAQVGERVRVKYKNRTQKYFTATVTDRNKVEVNL